MKSVSIDLINQFPQVLIQTNGESQLGIILSTTIRNWSLVGLLMYEQSIELGAFFFSRKILFFRKTSLKITYKHHLSKNVPIA